MGTYIDKYGNIRHTRSGAVLKRWVDDNKFTGSGHHIDVEKSAEKEGGEGRLEEGDLVKSGGFCFDIHDLSCNFKGMRVDKVEQGIYKVTTKQFKKQGEYFIEIKDWESDDSLVVSADSFKKIVHKRQHINESIRKYQRKVDYLTIYLNYLKQL